MAAGHGGQVVLSDVTAALIRDDWDVTDLGEHRLAGVDREMRLWQVGGREFPPLRTVDRVTGTCRRRWTASWVEPTSSPRCRISSGRSGW